LADVNNIDKKVLNEILPKVGEGSKVCTDVMVSGDNGLVSAYTVCGKVHFEVVHKTHHYYRPILVGSSMSICDIVSIEKRISTSNIYEFSLNRVAKVVCRLIESQRLYFTTYTLLGFLNPVDKLSSEIISKLERSEIPKYMLSKILENKKIVVKKEGNTLKLSLDDELYKIDLDNGKLYTITPTEKLKVNSYYVIIDKNRGEVALYTMSLTNPDKAYKYVVGMELVGESTNRKDIIEYAISVIKKFLLKYGYESGNVIYTDFRVVKRIPVLLKYYPEYVNNYNGKIAHYVDKLEVVSKSNLFNPSWYYFTPLDRYFYFVINYNGNSYLVRYPAHAEVRLPTKPMPYPEEKPVEKPQYDKKSEEPSVEHEGNHVSGNKEASKKENENQNHQPNKTPENIHEGLQGNKKYMNEEENKRQEESRKNQEEESKGQEGIKKEQNFEEVKTGAPHEYKTGSHTVGESLVEIKVKTSWPFGVWVMIPELSFIRLFYNNDRELIKMSSGKQYKIYTKKRFTLLYRKHYYTAGTIDHIKGLFYKVYLKGR